MPQAQCSIFGTTSDTQRDTGGHGKNGLKGIGLYTKKFGGHHMSTTTTTATPTFIGTAQRNGVSACSSRKS